MRIGFLFNHYASHQILHAAPIAFELSRRWPQADVSVITAGPWIEATALRLARRYPEQRCRFVRAKVPRGAQWLDPIVRHVKSIRKDAVLAANAGLFAQFDILVVPEKTSLKLKADPRCRHVKFVYTHHGAGDRAAAFYPELRAFDLVLAPGPKIRDRLTAEGLVEAARCRIVGYPKFEVAGALADGPPAFAERRPTVLYNPHFERGESSWCAMGRSVLEFFRKSPDYNLIFAPHVLLYRRAIRHGARPLGRYRGLSNIHVDTGSAASIDMTHLMAADVYLGDVSSQIYEFLRRPRPCVFLDAHGIDGWEHDPSYQYWRAGPVLRSAADLAEGLARARGAHESFEPVQRTLFDQTFDAQSVPASTRAADTIAEFFDFEVPRTEPSAAATG